MATYFKSTPTFDWSSDWQSAGGEPSFKTQLDNQQAAIDTAQNAYNAYQGNVDKARTAYDEAYGNQTKYGDLYAQAKESEGVNEARDQYQKSLNAVNATNAAMNRLPSSVNANSNVVLNSNQRNAALANQTAAYQNTLNDWVTQAAGDQSMYQTAIGAAQNMAGQQMSQEQANVNQAMTRYQTEINQLNQLYAQAANEKAIMQQIYGNMYNDKYNAYQRQLEVWADNLKAETSRYVAAQQAAAQNAYLEYMRELEEKNKSSDSTNQPQMGSYIDSYGNYYDGNGNTGVVKPAVTQENGKTVYTYAAPLGSQSIKAPEVNHSWWDILHLFDSAK